VLANIAHAAIHIEQAPRRTPVEAARTSELPTDLIS
jgi:hypothetical protein